MTFCGSCGSQSIAGDQFCRTCGNPPNGAPPRAGVVMSTDVNVRDEVLRSTVVADWREPSLDAQLRWGSYSPRYAIGLGLVLIGLVGRAPITALTMRAEWGVTIRQVAGSATISALVLVGFFALPAIGRARAWAVPLVTLALMADVTFRTWNPNIYQAPTSFAESALMISAAFLASLAWCRLRGRSVGATFISLGVVLALFFMLEYLAPNLLEGLWLVDGEAKPVALMTAWEMVVLFGAAWIARVVDPPLRAAGERRRAVRALWSATGSAAMASGSPSQGPALSTSVPKGHAPPRGTTAAAYPRQAASPALKGMSFLDAVRSGLSQYVGFSGRARRSEFWWFALFNAGVSLLVMIGTISVAMLISALTGSATITAITIALAVADLLLLAMFLPTLAMTIRRLHDTNRSGWFYLMAFIPFAGSIILLVFALDDSGAGPNRYGPSPKYI